MTRGRVRVPALVLSGLACVAVVAGCSGTDEGAAAKDGPSTTASTDATAATTTTSITEPSLSNTGEDLVATTLSIASYRRWLLDHPRPELLENIVRRSCSCWDANFRGLEGLANRGWRYEPALPPYEPPTVSLRDRPTPETAVVYVVLPPTKSSRVVDPSGAVIQEIAASGPRGALYTLVRDGGRWRIGDISDVGPVGEQP